MGRPSAPDGLNAIMFVKADSPIRNIKDLAGKKLGIGNEDSYEKSYSVRKLLAEQGVKPQFVLKPTCLGAAAAVKDGEVDAAAVSSYAYLFGTLEAVELPAARQLAATDDNPIHHRWDCLVKWTRRVETASGDCSFRCPPAKD